MVQVFIEELVLQKPNWCQDRPKKMKFRDSIPMNWAICGLSNFIPLMCQNLPTFPLPKTVIMSEREIYMMSYLQKMLINSNIESTNNIFFNR